MHNLSKPR